MHLHLLDAHLTLLVDERLFLGESFSMHLTSATLLLDIPMSYLWTMVAKALLIPMCIIVLSWSWHFAVVLTSRWFTLSSEVCFLDNSLFVSGISFESYLIGLNSLWHTLDGHVHESNTSPGGQDTIETIRRAQDLGLHVVVISITSDYNTKLTLYFTCRSSTKPAVLHLFSRSPGISFIRHRKTFIEWR